jgi:hypothetical protein
MRQRQAFALYTKEVLGALALYAGVLVSALVAAQRIAPGPARLIVLLTPMIPFLLAAGAVVRGVRRMDEFVRLWTLENVAIAAGVTAAWTFAYGFLENAGLPRLSMFTVWPVMAAAWVAAGSLRRLTER